MKTEDDVRTLLRDAARDYPTAPPPTRLVIDRGRRAKSRRLAWVAGGAAASVIVLAVVAGVAGHVDTGSGRIGPTRGHDDLNSDQASTMPMLIGLTPTD
ncbi:MAG TPA: hypothetical protein VLK34_01815, partial [Nocardioidaceae bacterium]|nr:hypothetical protein [Nocardioidaceae bacterium]